MKVICKRKPFKINNSSEVLYGLHISNAPTMGGERCNERFGGKLHSLQHYCEWVDHFTPSISSSGSITRGGEVVND